jgi:hypothetical protein
MRRVEILPTPDLIRRIELTMEKYFKSLLHTNPTGVDATHADFLHRDLSYTKNKFLGDLRAIEGDLHFTLDGYVLLVRNLKHPEKSYMVTYDPNTQKCERQIVTLKNYDMSQELRRLYEGKWIVAACGSARSLTPADDTLIQEVTMALLNSEQGILVKRNRKDVIVAGGGFSQGVPYFSVLAAWYLKIQTIAIAPSIAKTTTLGGIDSRMYSENGIHFVGEYWGEERDTLIGLADVVVIMGGGQWTQLELEKALELGKEIWIVDILGTGRLSADLSMQAVDSDVVHFLDALGHTIQAKVEERRTLEISGQEPIKMTRISSQGIIRP